MWGGHLVFDEITFSARPSNEVDSVAARALTLLAANTGNSARSSPFKSLVAYPERAKPLIQRLYDASCSPNRQHAISVMKELQESEASVSDIISVLVPGVARKLGEDWVDDKASFGAVTIGCARLQACVHHLERSFAERPLKNCAHQTNCLVAVPEGAQHTLGAVVLAAELRQAGPHAQLALDVSASKMARLVRSEHYDVIMISAAIGQDIDALRALVSAARLKGSRSKIIVGGGLVAGEIMSENKLTKAIGADLATCDWRQILAPDDQGLHSAKATPR